MCAAVRKIISNEHVHVAVTVEISRHRAVGEPPFAVVGQFNRLVIGGGNAAGLPGSTPAVFLRRKITGERPQ